MNKLKKYRKQKGLSQQELADASGLSLRTIQDYEQNKRNISGCAGERLYKFALVLGCKIEDFLENKEEIEKKIMIEGDKNMTELDVNILMMDGCTRTEAERHLKNGAIVISKKDFEKNFGLYMDQWGIEEDVIPEYKSMLNSKNPVEDWGIVEHNNETWYIMYVL